MSKAIEFLETRLGLDSNVSGKDRVDSNIIDIAEIMEDYTGWVIKNAYIQEFQRLVQESAPIPTYRKGA